MDDSTIVTLYWERSESAIAATAEKYSRYCGSIAYNILRNLKDMEECLNDTYLRAWNAIPPARPSMLSAFLGKITRNLAINMYEKGRAEKRSYEVVDALSSELENCIPDISAELNDLFQSEQIRNSLNSFLEGLKKTHRKVFVRRYWYMNSVEEISDYYGLTETNVKSILHRTREKLRKKLEKEDFLL